MGPDRWCLTEASYPGVRYFLVRAVVARVTTRQQTPEDLTQLRPDDVRGANLLVTVPTNRYPCLRKNCRRSCSRLLFCRKRTGHVAVEQGGRGAQPARLSRHGRSAKRSRRPTQFFTAERAITDLGYVSALLRVTARGARFRGGSPHR